MNSSNKCCVCNTYTDSNKKVVCLSCLRNSYESLPNDKDFILFLSEIKLDNFKKT